MIPFNAYRRASAVVMLESCRHELLQAFFALPLALGVLGLACGGGSSDDGASSDSAIVTQGPAPSASDDGKTTSPQERVTTALLHQRIQVNADTDLSKTDDRWSTWQSIELAPPIEFGPPAPRTFYYLSCKLSYAAPAGTTAARLAEGETYTIETLGNVTATHMFSPANGAELMGSVVFDLTLSMAENDSEASEADVPPTSTTLEASCSLELSRGVVQATHDLIWGSALSFK
jgi:hypothetical protein